MPARARSAGIGTSQATETPRGRRDTPPRRQSVPETPPAFAGRSAAPSSATLHRGPFGVNRISTTSFMLRIDGERPPRPGSYSCVVSCRPSPPVVLVGWGVCRRSVDCRVELITVGQNGNPGWMELMLTEPLISFVPWRRPPVFSSTSV